MRKVAIFGANGYIGRNLAFALNASRPDCEVNLYDIGPASIDGASNYTSVNMTDRQAMESVDLSCDTCFMLVGRTGSSEGFDEYDSFIDSNERALLNLLSEYRRQDSDAKIIFPSTRLVYKGGTGLLREEAAKEFKTVYAVNKFACEQYLKQSHEVFGARYAVFRICVPYGTLVEGASSYGTAEFMLSRASKGENIVLYGDGSVRRTFTYMGDLCEALIRGAESNLCENDIYNIGGENRSLREIAERIAEKYGVGITHSVWPELALAVESGDTVFDSTKLDSLIGGYTSVSVSDWLCIA